MAVKCVVCGRVLRLTGLSSVRVGDEADDPNLTIYHESTNDDERTGSGSVD